jgi:hypothetical protein
MARQKVKVQEIERGTNPRFEELMRRYQAITLKVDALSEERKLAIGQQDNLKALLKEEVQNMGLGRGSKLKIDGVGAFSFTTNRYYACTKERRLELVDLLIERGEKSLLTIGKADLASWASEVDEDEDQTLPDFVTFFEDKFVPRVAVDKTKATQQRNEEAKTP